MSEAKTKPPTEKKLRDAREDGETVKSTDATSAGVLAAAAGILWVSAGFMMDRTARLFAMVWNHLPGPDDPFGPLLAAMGWELLLLTVPVAFATLAGAVLTLIVQGAMTMSAEPVMFKLDAVNPASGLKKIFGMKATIEAGTMLVKSAVLFALLYVNLKALLPLLVGATARSPELLGVLMWQVLMRLLFVAVGFFVVFGLLDYGIQKMMFLREHRMSEDDIKRENKEQTGNPEVKQVRKDLAQELLLGDTPTAVASANMVVANPTHFAVAIFYRRGGLPQVVAKGQDAAALNIRMLAEASDVPVIVNPPLARTLFQTPLGAGIPKECFQAVGLLLHWVEQLQASRPGSAPSTPTGPTA